MELNTLRMAKLRLNPTFFARTGLHSSFASVADPSSGKPRGTIPVDLDDRLIVAAAEIEDFANE